MKLGTTYPQIELGGDPQSLRRFAEATEQLGYDHILLYDHVVGAVHEGRDPPLWGPYTEKDPFHDIFTAFAFLAPLTTRIELISGILILPQRQTVLVAKQAADLDLLCGGRLRLGVGTGWNYVEYDALGQDFAARGARLDEQVPYLRRLWTESLVSMEGRFDRIERGNVLPRPTRSIPIWMGGFSEPAFRRGAQLGDGFNFAGDPSRVADGVARVRHHRQAAGRSMEGYGLDLTLLRVSDLDAVAAAADAWRALGGTHLSVSSMWLGLESSVEAHLDFFGRVIDRLTAG